jgi:hypothetical protein
VDAVQKRLQFSILGAGGDPLPSGDRVARPKATKAGKKKGRGKKGKPSMQRQGAKPHPLPKKAKRSRRRK